MSERSRTEERSPARRPLVPARSATLVGYLKTRSKGTRQLYYNERMQRITRHLPSMDRLNDGRNAGLRCFHKQRRNSSMMRRPNLSPCSIARSSISDALEVIMEPRVWFKFPLFHVWDYPASIIHTVVGTSVSPWFETLWQAWRGFSLTTGCTNDQTDRQTCVFNPYKLYVLKNRIMRRYGLTELYNCQLPSYQLNV